ncbi:MAG: A/G-specific adenine glycosylase [bacterium]
MPAQQGSTWVSKLCNWFQHAQRPMPWRETPSGYRIWVSEIMLQQTQVATVIPYFQRFMTRFPSILDLAQADLDEVLKLWQGLGYYSRARNLHKGAQFVCSHFNQTLPSDYSTLQTIPGIGPYSAAAIASIAFKQAVPVVDGNVLRVFTRFWGINDDIRKSQVSKTLFEKLSPFIKQANPADFNQAMMELGALICSPTKPECSACPLQADCNAYKNNTQSSLPYKSKAKKVPTLHIVVGIISKGSHILIAKRPKNKMLGGLWEFPGGKIKTGESHSQALIREINEEVSLIVKPQTKLACIHHSYSHFHLRMHAYPCTIISGHEQPNCADELRWISPDQLSEFAFPKANLKLFDYLKDRKSAKT